MFDISLTTPELELRHVTEADLARLTEILPDDVEQNPSSTTYDGLDSSRNRAAVVHQDYWRARGAWRPESWALSFAVFHHGELVGKQGLEGDDFPTLRTVDSFSFLTGAARGRGWGKQTRAAVLTLAFVRSMPSSRSRRPGQTITHRWVSPEPSGLSRTASRLTDAATAQERWPTCGLPAKPGWHLAGRNRWRSPESMSAWCTSAFTEPLTAPKCRHTHISGDRAPGAWGRCRRRLRTCGDLGAAGGRRRAAPAACASRSGSGRGVCRG